MQPVQSVVLILRKRICDFVVVLCSYKPLVCLVSAECYDCFDVLLLCFVSSRPVVGTCILFPLFFNQCVNWGHICSVEWNEITLFGIEFIFLDRWWWWHSIRFHISWYSQGIRSSWTPLSFVINSASKLVFV